MGKQLIDFSKVCYDRLYYCPALTRGVWLCAKIGECEFIDFKEEFHKCKAELVHDILCLANAHSEYDRYIIYGIKDDEKDRISKHSCDDDMYGLITGVTDEDFATEQITITQILDGCGLNKNLSNYVHLHKFIMTPSQPVIRDASGKYVTSGKRLLIFHIESVPLKPFFLTQDYEGKKKGENGEETIIKVEAYKIYTRHRDSNTSKTTLKNIVSNKKKPQKKGYADDSEMELMYRERFGIDKTPRDKAFMYIENPDDWVYDETNGFIYCLSDPKYKIKRREKTNFAISDEVRKYINHFHPEKQEMCPESYYIEYEGCDINMWIDVIIISNTTVIPNIYCRGDESAGLEIPCTDGNLRALFVGGVKKFCEIIQNDYNRKNKTDIRLNEKLQFYNAVVDGPFCTGTGRDGVHCNHEFWADYYSLEEHEPAIMNTKTYDHDS